MVVSRSKDMAAVIQKKVERFQSRLVVPVEQRAGTAKNGWTDCRMSVRLMLHRNYALGL